ncbi:ABC transporter substrate-binding protein [Psychroserpens sp. SPM9]|uniref:ABC transporter substrate-binding protein n=1 Tax=Psychroserpens sp. SPM9 TaxID=2975598 RepID=UPI0021A4D7CD|nr:helical backbone metal receptor [Psychroserpens sp. SPM9]MDG5492577.1 helical backbone metal receptor [Psychroserpens sp. SPM9]
MNYKDQLNRTLKFKETPKRIVSLVPSQTELLVDLGLESFIVGITKFCVHPAHLRDKKTVVGGTKQVHYDKIIALNPDIILCNKEENTKEMISELETIAPVHISDIFNLDDAFELIQIYGDLFSVEKNSEELIQNIARAQQDFSNYLKGQPKLNVAYFIWKNPWMVAAKHTFIDALLQLNNFENHFKNFERYPEIDMETLVNVDLLLLSSEPFPFNASHVEGLKQRFPKANVILVDGEYFSWYGSRLKDAFGYFKTLHQNLLS